MRYRFTYSRPEGQVDLEVAADAAATVGDVARALLERDPHRTQPRVKTPTLEVSGGSGGAVLPAQQKLIDSALRSGATVSIRPAQAATIGNSDGPAAILTVIEGRQAGQSFNLFHGQNTLGSDPELDIVLTDPTVAAQHARITVDEQVEILDLTYSGGVRIGGVAVPRAVLRPEWHCVLGESVITVRPVSGDSAADESVADAFVRRAHLSPVFEEESYELPELPQQPEPSRFPLVALILPILMGGLLFAVTKQVTSLLFIALSPLMMLGNWFENRQYIKRRKEQSLAEFGAALESLDATVRARQGAERKARRHEHPDSETIAGAIQRRSALLWSRRPDRPGFLQLRLGSGRMPARVTVEEPRRQSGDHALWERLLELQRVRNWIDDVPVVVDLPEAGVLGIAGPGERGESLVRALIVQAAGLHSPHELAIGAFVGNDEAGNWEWLKWLPHTMPRYAPVDVDLLADRTSSAAPLISAVEELIDSRLAASAGEPKERPETSLLLLVSHNAGIERSRAVDIAERGARAGVYVIWYARDLAQIPAACRTFVAIDNRDHVTVGFVSESRSVPDVTLESLSRRRASEVARSLAPVTDSGAKVEDSSDLPTSVPYLALTDMRIASESEAVVEQWQASGSLSSRAARSVTASASLRCIIGQGATGPITLDLKTQGPHALVGGTTGSGKSELLQTWVIGLAAAYSPEKVTFLFVDYKGGSAFGECVDLPHSVGLVTDLSPHLVKRALKSLHAELRYRERILNEAKAKDLETLIRRGRSDAPPSLIIVVDEFAALATDVPEFVDGVVNVAQRGRSLGLHLILATQRPAGVIRDNLRANTNLRVALRVADEEDSVDVIGSKDAAHFAADAPGRAAIRAGSARLVPFQCGYVGGHTSATDQVTDIEVREVGLGSGSEWLPRLRPRSDTTRERVTDLSRMVGTIASASQTLAISEPRRPWLPELSPVVDLAATTAADATDQRLVIGIGDVPEDQQQPPVAFEPDSDGNLAVFGTGGSGKSGVLRTIAVAAGLARAGGPVHIYGLDFASQGLKMLEPLPHVGAVIAGDDDERVLRLLRRLRALIDQRALRYAAAQVSSITEYRKVAGKPLESRVIVLLDGLAAFRSTHDSALPGNPLQLLTSIAADGRPVGVHLVVTADRPATMPSALGSLVPRRLSLRQADDNDLLTLGVPRDLFTPQSPPGRGYMDEQELQIAVVGGSASVAVQAQAIEALAQQDEVESTWPVAPEIRRLSDDIALDSLPASVDGQVIIGVEDADLQPFGIELQGTFIVTGPPSSGRTTVVATLARAVRRARPDITTVLLASARSPLGDLEGWTESARDITEAAMLAGELTARIPAEPAGSLFVVIEGVGEFVNSEADLPVQQLLRACRLGGHMVVGEADTQTITGGWPLQQALRHSRTGIVLQPDQNDGEMVFKTPFPRVKRADFPQGRGLMVRGGRWYRVQVAR